MAKSRLRIRRSSVWAGESILPESKRKEYLASGEYAVSREGPVDKIYRVVNLMYLGDAVTESVLGNIKKEMGTSFDVSDIYYQIENAVSPWHRTEEKEVNSLRAATEQDFLTVITKHHVSASSLKICLEKIQGKAAAIEEDDEEEEEEENEEVEGLPRAIDAEDSVEEDEAEELYGEQDINRGVEEDELDDILSDDYYRAAARRVARRWVR